MDALKRFLSKEQRSGWFAALRSLVPLVLAVVSLPAGFPSIAVAAPPAVEKPATLPSEIPAGYESYLRRPDILKLKPQSHPELGKDWESLKRGHAEAVAMMLEMYPDRELYFLARDSELLYDLAKIVAQGHPEQQKRLHLLNVSRANMRAPHVREYLAQEGISEASLKAGKKVLFVDTGFSGTIPRVISELFPEDLRRQLETQLMCSSNKAHPSIRGFLAAINPAAPSLTPGSLHGSIVGYEHMPRFTDRSDGFAKVQGRWEPISPQGKSNDGQVSPQKAQAHQEDLRAYAESAEAQALITQRRAQWKRLRELSQAPGPTNDALVAELRALLAAQPKDPFTEALVRDFLDLRETNLAPNGVRPPLSASDLGLSEIGTVSGGSSNKNTLIKNHPEWAPVLENPQTGIAKLIESGEWGKLGAITDAIHDQEFTRLLAQSLGAPASAGKPGLESFVKMLIEKADPETLRSLAEHTFSKPHTAEMKDLLKLLIEKGEIWSLRYLARYTFSQPHTAGMEDLLKLLIEKEGPGVVTQDLAELTFSQPHTAEMKEALRLLIEKGDLQTLRNLAEHTFSKPHTAQMKDLLKLFIEKGDFATLQCLAAYTFSKPHATEMKDHLKLLIEKANPETLQILAEQTFSKPHAAEMKDLLKLLIEKGDPVTLQILADNALKKPHWSQPEHNDLRKAVQIQDPVARKAFLQGNPLPVPAPASQPELVPALASVKAGKTTASLKAGDTVATPSGRSLRVLEFVDEGKRGRVYRVRDEASGKDFALKVARDSEAATLASLAQELDKAKLYQKLGIPHAPVLETQPDFVLKEWVEGTRADAWIQAWMAQGAPPDAPQIEGLRKLLERSAEQGAYIGDLNAKNLIWRGSEWVVIDSGDVREGLSVEEAWGRYIEKIPARWGKKAGNPAATSCLAQALTLLSTLQK